jgi:hypothetical protein
VGLSTSANISTGSNGRGATAQTIAMNRHIKRFVSNVCGVSPLKAASDKAIRHQTVNYDRENHCRNIGASDVSREQPVGDLIVSGRHKSNDDKTARRE